MRIQPPPVPDDVRALRSAFLARGFDLWPVGGYVRDLILGEAPKDLDLSTDATPDEQASVYAAAGVRFAPTGAAHGTLTAILASGPCEITSLRRDVATDGRRATVAFTRDRVEDLGRRDLTINAISVDLDGEVLDPFGGVEDLAARRIRFVGDPGERMREDYLRILRWLRFSGRFAPGAPLDREAVEAARANGPGLDGISRERVWSEFSRILSGPGAVTMTLALRELGLDAHVDLPEGDVPALAALAADGMPPDPALMMSAYLGYDAGKVEALAAAWRWSREDAQRTLYACAARGRGTDPRREVAVNRRRPDWAAAMARADGDPEAARAVASWSPPAFPLDGRALARAGFEKGPAMGEVLARLRGAWADSGYALGADELLEMAMEPGEGASPAP